METWRNGGSFLDRLKADPDVTKRLSAQQLEAQFDLGYHFKHVDTIFDRVFGAAAAKARAPARLAKG
jgi:adenylosuccinate lyase